VIVIIISAQLLGFLGMIISIPVFSILKLTVTTAYTYLVSVHGRNYPAGPKKAHFVLAFSG